MELGESWMMMIIGRLLTFDSKGPGRTRLRDIVSINDIFPRRCVMEGDCMGMTWY
jgi:hypothetical protein